MPEQETRTSEQELKTLAEINTKMEGLTNSVTQGVETLRNEMTDVKVTLGIHTEHLKRLIGNGRPGIIQEMDDDIHNLKTAKEIQDVKVKELDEDVGKLKAEQYNENKLHWQFKGGWWLLVKIGGVVTFLLAIAGFILSLRHHP